MARCPHNVAVKLALCICIALFAAATALAAADDLVPSPRLRPSDPAKFYPGSVKMAGIHLQELRSVVHSNLNNPELAEQLVDHKAVRKAATDVPFLCSILPYAEGNVQEWALKSLGEAEGDKSAALPILLRLAADRAQPDAVRALAVRVSGTMPLDRAAVGTLTQALPSSSRDLRILILEALRHSSASALPYVSRIEPGLRERDAAIQFHSYRTLEQIEAASQDKLLSADYSRAQTLKSEWEAPTLTAELTRNLASHIQDTASRGLVVALAMLAAAKHPVSDPELVAAILHRTGDTDVFIAELAGNVFARLDSLAKSSLGAFTRSLTHTNSDVRIRAAEGIAKIGPDATTAVPQLAHALERVPEHRAPPKEIAAYCGALRPLGTNAASASRAVLALLPEESPIYRDLRKHEAYELRAWLLVTLAEIGVPMEALPFVLDGLANTEDEMPQLFAAAARAAAALGPAAKDTVPFLLRPLKGAVKDTFINFTSFGEHASRTRNYTTCQVEALRALARIGRPAEPAVPLIEDFLRRDLPDFDHPNRLHRAPNLRAEANAALAAIKEAH